MKALFWQWTLITTLCLAAQCIASPFDNSKYLQVSGLRPMNLYAREVAILAGFFTISDWNQILQNLNFRIKVPRES